MRTVIRKAALRGLYIAVVLLAFPLAWKLGLHLGAWFDNTPSGVWMDPQ